MYKNHSFFDEIVIPLSLSRFEKLSKNREKYEGTISETKVKELTSPILMILLKRPELLQKVLLIYFDICKEGVLFFNGKLEQLLKGVIKEAKQIEELSTFIFAQYIGKPSENRILNLIYKLISVAKHKTAHYKVFIESLKNFYKNHMHQFFSLMGNIDTKVIVDIFISFFENESNYEHLNLEQVFNQWMINVEDFILSLCFSEKQQKRFTLCASLLDNIMKAQSAAIDTRLIFGNILTSYKEAELKELPPMIVYCGLLFAEKDKRDRKTVDFYLDIFKEGISKGMYNNDLFWQFLLRYCIMDRIIAEETVASLLPENLQLEFFDQYRKLKG